MEKNLELIEKIWVLLGTILTFVGLNGQLPWVGEVFTEQGGQIIVAVVSAVITAFQFFRGKVSDGQIVVDDGDVLQTERGAPSDGFNAMSVTKVGRLNTSIKHLLNPFSKRIVA